MAIEQVSLDELLKGYKTEAAQSAPANNQPERQPEKKPEGQTKKDEFRPIPTLKSLRKGGSKKWSKVSNFFKPAKEESTEAKNESFGERLTRIFREIRTEVRKCFAS